MAGLQEKAALMLGGIRGIGAVIVRHLSEDGARVTFTHAGSREAAERLAGETAVRVEMTDSAGSR